MKIISLTLILLTCASTLLSQKIHTSLHQSWHNGIWQDSLQRTYTYDGRGLLSSMTEQRWSSTTGSWHNSRMETHTYNADSTEQQETIQIWDTISHIWQNLEMTTNTYSSPRFCSIQLRQKWVNGSWQNAMLLNYSYDKKGMLVQDLWQIWHPTTSAWVNQGRFDYTYNANGKMTKSTEKMWDTVRHTWSKNREAISEFSYDSASRCVAQSDIINIHNRWRDNFKTQYTYDEHGHKTAMKCTVWDDQHKNEIQVWREDFNNNADGSINHTTDTRWSRSSTGPVGKVMVKYTYL